MWSKISKNLSPENFSFSKVSIKKKWWVLRADTWRNDHFLLLPRSGELSHSVLLRSAYIILHFIPDLWIALSIGNSKFESTRISYCVGLKISIEKLFPSLFYFFSHSLSSPLSSLLFFFLSLFLCFSLIVSFNRHTYSRIFFSYALLLFSRSLSFLLIIKLF